MSHHRLRPQARPRLAVVVIGWLMAAWCVGFAVVNIVLEGANHLADGVCSEYSAAFAAMNWLVVGLKLLGAGVAVLSVSGRRPPVSTKLLGVAVWGAFATLGVYVVGGIGQAIGMASGVAREAGQIDLIDMAYLVLFLLAAINWGVLAISYSTRHGLGWGIAALGVLAAPVVLGLLLVVMPMLLAALGLMPAA